MEEALNELITQNAELEEEVRRQSVEAAELQALLQERERDAEHRGDTGSLKAAVKALHEYANKVASKQIQEDGQQVQKVDRTLSWAEDSTVDLNRVASSVISIVADLDLALMKSQFESDENQLALDGLEADRRRLETELAEAQGAPVGAREGQVGSSSSREAEAALQASALAAQEKLSGLERLLSGSSANSTDEELVVSPVGPGPDSDDNEEEEEPLDGMDLEQLTEVIVGLRGSLEEAKSKRRQERWDHKKLRAQFEKQQGSMDEKIRLEAELMEVQTAWQRQQTDFDKLRKTLQNDLNAQVERYVALKMQVEEERSSPSKEGSPEQSKEREMIVSLQRRLDSVTSDHQWLLQQYVAINTQAGELRKKASLREQHVKQLETAMHQQTARHEDEVAKLSADISKAQARELQLREALQNLSIEATAPELLEDGAGDGVRGRSTSFEERLKCANESFSGRITAQLNKVVAPLRAGSGGIPMSAAGGRVVTPIKGGGLDRVSGAMPSPMVEDLLPQAPTTASAAEDAGMWSRMKAAFAKKQ